MKFFFALLKSFMDIFLCKDQEVKVKCWPRITFLPSKMALFQFCISKVNLQKRPWKDPDKAYGLDFFAKYFLLYFVKCQKKWTNYLEYFLSYQKNVWGGGANRKGLRRFCMVETTLSSMGRGLTTLQKGKAKNYFHYKYKLF